MLRSHSLIAMKFDGPASHKMITNAQIMTGCIVINLPSQLYFLISQLTVLGEHGHHHNPVLNHVGLAFNKEQGYWLFKHQMVAEYAQGTTLISVSAR